ncbi:MAG TPA: hypothetical protein VLI06_15070, partial [Solimonas sp.]|nr:hypothetical protein [Solimonas sp.]
MFAKKKPTLVPSLERLPSAYLTAYVSAELLQQPERLDALHQQMPDGQRCELQPASALGMASVESEFVLALFLNPLELDRLADQVL